jgi:ABC-type Zn uptake system ZnuABC Zn-binding protein ZnuA
MRQQHVDLVVRELQYPAGLAETVAQVTGAKLVELPVMSGGRPDTKDYISFIDYNVRTMLNVVQSGARTAMEPAANQSGHQPPGS